MQTQVLLTTTSCCRFSENRFVFDHCMSGVQGVFDYVNAMCPFYCTSTTLHRLGVMSSHNAPFEPGITKKSVFETNILNQEEGE